MTYSAFRDVCGKAGKMFSLRFELNPNRSEVKSSQLTVFCFSKHVGSSFTSLVAPSLSHIFPVSTLRNLVPKK